MTETAKRMTVCMRCGCKSVEGYVHRSQWTAGIPCTDACLTCGAIVAERTQHSAWHRSLDRRGSGCACGPEA